MKVIATLLVCLSLLPNCFGQDSVKTSKPLKQAPWFVERFRITGGFFVPSNVTKLQVGINGGVGTDIDFEKDLGFTKNELTFLANFQWRTNRRSRINLTYYNIPRSATHTIDKDIMFNGQTYPVNATVNSVFNTAIYQITYGYAVLAKPNYELGFLIGTHLVNGKVGMAINSTASANSDFHFIAPVPDLGIWGGYAFNKRLAVNLDFTYLAVSDGNFSGRILAYNLLFIYKALEKLDLTMGYSGLNFSLDVRKASSEGHFKWGYNGPALGVIYSFGKKAWTH